MAFYKVQEFEDLSNPLNKHLKSHKNTTYCFICNGTELPIHWLTIADVFGDAFVSYIACEQGEERREKGEKATFTGYVLHFVGTT